MKKLKIIALSTLAFLTIASTIFVSCQKPQDINNSLTVKKEKTRQWKKIIDYLGIKITVEGASGCLYEEFFPNGARKLRSCSGECPVCYVDIKFGTPIHKPNQGQGFVGEIVINSLNNVSLWVLPENVSSEILNNLSDGSYSVENPFGIGFGYNEDDIIIIPNGSYNVELENNGSYRIDFVF